MELCTSFYQLMVLGQLLSEVYTLFEINLATGEFLARGEIPPPGLSALLHMYLHLLLHGQLKEHLTSLQQLLPEPFLHTMPLHIEKSRSLTSLAYLLCGLFLAFGVSHEAANIDEWDFVEVVAFESVALHYDVIIWAANLVKSSPAAVGEIPS